MCHYFPHLLHNDLKVSNNNIKQFEIGQIKKTSVCYSNRPFFRRNCSVTTKQILSPNSTKNQKIRKILQIGTMTFSKTTENNFNSFCVDIRQMFWCPNSTKNLGQYFYEIKNFQEMYRVCFAFDKMKKIEPSWVHRPKPGPNK